MMKKIVFWQVVLVAIATCAALASTTSTWDNGVLLFRDTITNETTEALAPVYFENEFIGLVGDSGGVMVIGESITWNFTTVNSGDAANADAASGYLRLTTGGADDDDVEIATGLTWYPSKYCAAEARFATNDADSTAFCFGFSDAIAEGADTLAFSYSTASLTTTASDAALFFWDPDGTTDYIRASAVKANTDGDLVASTTVQADSVFHVYRVEIDASGNVDYWLDGVHLAQDAAAVTTTTPLCVYFGFINREGAANTFDIDYVRAWQGR